MSEPVQIGTTSVAPGDLIVGNQDGIVVVPRLRAAEILKLSVERNAKDPEIFALMNAKRSLPWKPPPGGRPNPFQNQPPQQRR